MFLVESCRARVELPLLLLRGTMKGSGILGRISTSDLEFVC